MGDHATAEIRQREAELFECADAVFTGGPSLYEAKRRFHPYVHCFPSSVDMSWDETVDRMDAILRQVANDYSYRETPAEAASIRSIA